MHFTCPPEQSESPNNYETVDYSCDCAHLVHENQTESTLTGGDGMEALSVLACFGTVQLVTSFKG